MRRTVAVMLLVLALLLVTIGCLEFVRPTQGNPSVFAIMPRTHIHSPENKTYATSAVFADVTFEVSQKVYDKSLDDWVQVVLDDRRFKIPAELVSSNDTWLVFHAETTLEGLSDGPHEAQFYCLASNLGSVYDTVARFIVETQAPTLTVTSPLATVYNNSVIPLTFLADEQIVSASFSLDGKARTQIDGNTTLTGLTDGNHNLIVYAVDAAGKEGYSEQCSFSVQESPRVSVLSPLNGTLFLSNNALTVAVSESTSWVQYSLDGKANATVTGNATLPWLSSGPHSLTVYACDEAGNIGVSETLQFAVAVVTWEWVAIALIPFAVAAAVLFVTYRKRKLKRVVTA